ncbi:MAG TPA: (Fe-S)-binding protein [Candidatus Binataceae bacterium]|jgi:L-lactate dehydrogenase complex protein LldE|nr:(Fe-S)-binding protein [Candidatus Binataceae bacterium]
MTEVRLFGTCLAEEFYPSALDAAARVLAGLRLKVRRVRRAFCCGQAAFNEGMRAEAAELGRRLLAACEPGVPVVVPSGSCAAMVRVYYADLFAGDPALTARAAALRPWVYEFSQFLVGVMKVRYLGARFEHAVAYHPSCHLLREMGVRDEPRLLLSAVGGIRLCELRNVEECCGFGGTFSVKFPHISAAMMADKLAAIRDSGADTVVANDAGCLMQIGGGLSRAGLRIETRHLAEVLAAR